MMKRGPKPRPQVPCRALGCGEFVKAKGLCRLHYHRFQKWGDALPELPRRPTAHTPEFIASLVADRRAGLTLQVIGDKHGCTRENIRLLLNRAAAKGFIPPEEVQALAHPHRSGTPCEAPCDPPCERPSVTMGLCKSHYSRINKGIDLDFPVHGRNKQPFTTEQMIQRRMLDKIDQGEHWIWRGPVLRHASGVVPLLGVSRKGSTVAVRSWIWRHMRPDEPENKRGYAPTCGEPLCVHPLHLAPYKPFTRRESNA